MTKAFTKEKASTDKETSTHVEVSTDEKASTKPKKAFRISAKKLYLTYSQVNQKMTSEYVISQLKANESLPRFDYLVSRELHQDGGVHFHALITSDTKFNIRSANILDLKFEDENFHGNYQPVRNLEKVVEYICKEGDYVTSFKNIIDGKLISLKQTIMRLADAEGIGQTLLNLCQDHTDKAFNSLGLINAEKFLEKKSLLQDELDAENVVTPFQCHDFMLPQKLQAWVDNPVKTLVLTGPSGIGKTQFVFALCKDKGLRPLFVNHKQGLSRLKSHHGAIVFDDFDLGSFSEAELLSFLSTDVVKNLRVLYKEVRKKSNLIQILTLNTKDLQTVVRYFRQKRFLRRIDFVQLEQPFINPNVVININVNYAKQVIINNNNNNHKSYAQVQQEEDAHCEDTLQRMLKCCQDAKDSRSHLALY